MHVAPYLDALSELRASTRAADLVRLLRRCEGLKKRVIPRPDGRRHKMLDHSDTIMAYARRRLENMGSKTLCLALQNSKEFRLVMVARVVYALSVKHLHRVLSDARATMDTVHTAFTHHAILVAWRSQCCLVLEHSPAFIALTTLRGSPLAAWKELMRPAL